MARPRVRKDRHQAFPHSPASSNHTFSPSSSPSRRNSLTPQPALNLGDGQEFDSRFIPFSSPTRRNTLTMRPTLYLSNGRKFTQQSHISRPFGQLGLREQPSGFANKISKSHPVHGDNYDNEESLGVAPTSESFEGQSTHYRKCLAQTTWWQTEVLPRLIRPYMRLLRQTENLRGEPSVEGEICTCKNVQRNLSIVTVGFHSRCFPFFIFHYSDVEQNPKRSKSLFVPVGQLQSN
jgi:hypothetical protein